MQARAQAPMGSRPTLASRAQTVRVSAFFNRGSTATVTVEEKKKTTTSDPKRKESVVAQTLNALDFAQVRSKQDAELLYEAKYGERGPDGKMTREQYMALRRKIGGTARDYWKDWIEEESPKYIKTYYKPEDSAGTVPYLPFLVGVVVAMIGATAVVVQQTS